MKKILIIEDNLDVRENIAEILELSNYKTITAKNGKEGIQKAIEDRPDLIICDVMMPEADGFSVLRILSKNLATMDIPFVFLTAKNDRKDLRMGMALGADDYITKPFTDIELLDAIEVRLNKIDRIKNAFDGTREGFSTFVNEAKGINALRALSTEREFRTYKKKEFLFKVDDVPSFLFFINSGRVKIFKTNEYGKEFITSIKGKGEFLGYLALLKNGKYSESATALEQTEISIIPKEDFLSLIHGDRDVSTQMIKILAKNIAEKEERLLRLAYDSVRRRVAVALMTVAKKSGVSQLQPAHFSIRREDLANLAGTTKETSIRTLADFREEGLLEMDYSKIKILNWDGLKNLPN